MRLCLQKYVRMQIVLGAEKFAEMFSDIEFEYEGTFSRRWSTFSRTAKWHAVLFDVVTLFLFASNHESDHSCVLLFRAVFRRAAR